MDTLETLVPRASVADAANAATAATAATAASGPNPAQSEQRPPRLAIQKDGRLTQDTLSLLQACGLAFDTYRSRLLSPCRNFPLTMLFCRDDDIPGYVAKRTTDLGVVGRNILLERASDRRDIVELRPLGFGLCRLVVAVPNEAPLRTLSDLRGKRVATSYPVSVDAFFRAQGVPVEIVEIAGGVEVTPALGVAEAIADLTATGTSLFLHDLRVIATIADSEAMLIASPDAMSDPQQRPIIDRFLLRLNGALTARRFKYIMMNAPRAALDAIRAITPGLREPTVMPLADPDWVAIHTVLEEASFWETIEQLRAAGASEILVTPVEKLVL